MSFEIQTCQFTIPLLTCGKVLVKEGEWVAKDELLMECNQNISEFDLAKILKTDPKKVGQFLMVSLGEHVKEGTCLAQRKSMLERLVFKSPSSGTFLSLSPDGVAKIETAPEKEIRSTVKAQVVNIEESTMTLEFTAVSLVGDWGTGNENWGEIEILSKEEVGVEDLPPKPQGKILVVKGKVLPGFVHKAEALSASGIVAGSLDGKVRTDDMSQVSVGEKAGILPVDVWNRMQKYRGKTSLIVGKDKTLRIPVE